MTPEELLRPRYKVIATWPGMELEPFHLHQIVTLQPHNDDTGDCFIYIPIKHVPGSYMRQGFFNSYSHLFKELKWAEERKAEELPKYVRTGSGKVLLVMGWHNEFCRGYGEKYYAECTFYTPATQSEYEAYNNGTITWNI